MRTSCLRPHPAVLTPLTASLASPGVHPPPPPLFLGVSLVVADLGVRLGVRLAEDLGVNCLLVDRGVRDVEVGQMATFSCSSPPKLLPGVLTRQSSRDT